MGKQAYLSRHGPGSFPSISEHPLLSPIRVPNRIYECCTGPRRDRRGSRAQAPRSTAVQAGASPIQTTMTAGTAGMRYRGESSPSCDRTAVKADACATESKLSPITGGHQQYPSHQGQQRLFEWQQEWSSSTGPIRVDIKSGVNKPWNRRAQYVGGMRDTVIGRARRSFSLPLQQSTPVPMSANLSPPLTTTTQGIISSPPPSHVSVADCGRERETRWLTDILAPSSDGGLQHGVETGKDGGGGPRVYHNYIPPSSADSVPSPSLTPSPTTTTCPRSDPQTRDHLSASITTTATAPGSPPLFEGGDADSLGPGLGAGMGYPSSPPSSSPLSLTSSLSLPMNFRIRTQEPPPFRRKQQLSSGSSIDIGSGGGGTMSQYGPRTDADSRAIDAFRPF
jgi:hypothetical protein